jgi:hypothetical protein
LLYFFWFISGTAFLVAEEANPELPPPAPIREMRQQLQTRVALKKKPKLKKKPVPSKENTSDETSKVSPPDTDKSNRKED